MEQEYLDLRSHMAWHIFNTFRASTTSTCPSFVSYCLLLNVSHSYTLEILVTLRLLIYTSPVVTLYLYNKWMSSKLMVTRTPLCIDIFLNIAMSAHVIYIRLQWDNLNMH